MQEHHVLRRARLADASIGVRDHTGIARSLSGDHDRRPH